MTNLTFQVAKNGNPGRTVSARTMNSIWTQYNSPLRKKGFVFKSKKGSIGGAVWVNPATHDEYELVKVA